MFSTLLTRFLVVGYRSSQVRTFVAYWGSKLRNWLPCCTGSLLGNFNTVWQCLGRNSCGPSIPLKTGKPKEGRGFVCSSTTAPLGPSVCEKVIIPWFSRFSLRKIFSFVLFMPQAQTKALSTPVLEQRAATLMGS